MNNRLTDKKTSMRFWPTPQDYCEAMQTPESSFQIESLRNAQPELDGLGMPRPISGGFASVYKLTGKETYAVRCFLANRPDQQERYKNISEFVLSARLPCTVNFEYLEEGIKINGKWFPILRMPWVTGNTLERFVMKHWNDKARMEALCEAYRLMDRDLRKSGIAHGDLQHGNILVTDSGELRLVDYDGMFVPSMKGWNSLEAGHANYQHPGRRETHFDHSLDNFSSLVIYTSLRAVAIDPSIVTEADCMTENLLLRSTDFQNPTISRMFQKLEGHISPEIRLLAQLTRYYLDESPLAAPALEDLPKEAPRQLTTNQVLSDDLRSGRRTEKSRQKARIHGEPHHNQNNEAPWWIVQSTQTNLPQQTQGKPQLVSLAPGVELELAKPVPRPTRYNRKQHRFAPWTKQLGLCLSPPVFVFVIVPLSYTATLSPCEADVTGIARPDDNRKEIMHGSVYYTFTRPGEEEQHTGVKYLPKGSPIQAMAEKTGKIQAWYSWLFPDSLTVSSNPPTPSYLEVVGLIVTIALSAWIWYTPYKQKRLARNGVAVRGKIVDKHEVVAHLRPNRYALRYEFYIGQLRYEGLMAISHADYKRIFPGNEVTVLYNQTNPHDSVVYKFSYYIVRP